MRLATKPIPLTEARLVHAVHVQVCFQGHAPEMKSMTTEMLLASVVGEITVRQIWLLADARGRVKGR
jgi:hypothetical protein